jgi:uncharacterized integral membrane protein (TIGR00698 family)
MRSFLRQNVPGMLLALAIAAVAYALGKLAPVVGGPVIGIALGIIVASMWGLPAVVAKGCRFTSKWVLQFAVVLLGFEMNLPAVIRVGRQSLLVIFLTLAVAFAVAYWVGKSLGINRKLATLIGVGTAICGGSAIAAASSAIDADDQDVSYSISTIFMFNVVAVFLFPVIGHLLHLSDTGFGMWAGTAINDTSSVVAASYSYSNAAGSFATIVKLTRTLMIVPVTLALAVIFARGARSGARFSLAKVFPWFVLGFLFAAVIRSVALVPAGAAATLGQAGKFLIISAMAAIGLNTNVRMFIKAGPRALLLGGATWLAVMLSSLAVQYATHLR